MIWIPNQHHKGDRRILWSIVSKAAKGPEGRVMRFVVYW